MKPHVLVIEDHPTWQLFLRKCLEELDPNICVDIASTRDDALAKVHHTFFPLIVLDYSLDQSDDELGDLQQLLGLKLVQDLKQHVNSQDSNMLVVSNHVSDESIAETLQRYHVKGFFRKRNFDEQRREEFKTQARSEILDALIKRAGRRASQRYHLEVYFNEQSLMGSGYWGPERSAPIVLAKRGKLDVKGFTAQTNQLGEQVETYDADLWRREARAIGQGIYDALTREPEFFRHLSQVQPLVRDPGDLWIEFKGPVTGLSVPFELIRENEQNLCMTHILTRQVRSFSTKGGSGRAFYRKIDPFHKFLKKLCEQNIPLRILIAGSNQGDLQMAEEEVDTLHNAMSTTLKTVGIRHSIDAIPGQKATYERVISALQNGSFHIFHFAGHGAHDQHNPENSGVALAGPQGEDGWMSAAQLATALGRKGGAELQLVFLNSCFSAAVADKPGRGDFHGVFDALVHADVPHVLGYRWSVDDQAAIEFAKAFYQNLWSTFSPGEALLEARRAATISGGSRDDDIWASPVMVAQNTRD